MGLCRIYVWGNFSLKVVCIVQDEDMGSAKFKDVRSLRGPLAASGGQQPSMRRASIDKGPPFSMPKTTLKQAVTYFQLLVISKNITNRPSQMHTHNVASYVEYSM